MNNNNIIIFEKINLINLFLIIIKLRIKKINKKFYYIYSSNFLVNIFVYFFNLLGFEFIQLKFKMKDVRDENYQMYRETIPESELFRLESLYKDRIKNIDFTYSNLNLKNYVLKSIFAENYTNKTSPFRIIYLINVINQLFYNIQTTKIIFYIEKIPCYFLYEKYAENKKIIIKSYFNKVNPFKYKLKIIANILRKILKYFLINYQKNIKSENNDFKLFCEGKSQPNLILNGNRSDFNWLISSDFLFKNVLYNCKDKKDIYELNKKGIHTTTDFQSLKNKSKKIIKNNQIISDLFIEKIDKNNINYHLINYEYTFNKWYDYFKTHNVKVFLNWYKYDSSHIPMSDAVNELGGISTFFQQNFDGFPFYECKIFADINFYHSKFSVILDNKISSEIDYNIITGYPSLPITNEMKIKSEKLRNTIKSNGAKKIICVLDENSLPDERWHTGDQMQIDNYIFLINELLKNKNLGIIFKPKSAYDLRRRLNDANKLLDEALNTGRCYLYDQTEDNLSHFTKPTPILAALSSDLVVHSHLCAGTAAIETAINGIPTILIDRENVKNSYFYEVLDKINIYSNWNDAIDSINENFLNKENKMFGNWKKIYSFI